MAQGKRLESIVDQFWLGVPQRSRESGGCWRWAGTVGTHGYGVLQFHRKQYRAHRVSWEIHNGLIPRKQFVCHRCDVRDCVNPHHLFLGDQLDNIRDMFSKGRQPRSNRGAGNPMAKLTEKQVREIRTVLRIGRWGAQAELAKKYGVSVNTISLIKRGLLWKSV